MSVDEQQLRATEQRVVDAMHAADRDGREPVELWARVERRLDRAAARRRWFPVTLAAGVAVTIILAVVVPIIVPRSGDRPTVATSPTDASIATIEAVCNSLVSMRRDVVPLPSDGTALGFTIERIQAAYGAASDAFDAVERTDLPPVLRAAYDEWKTFESDALDRIDRAAMAHAGGSTTAARRDASRTLAMMAIALGSLSAAGVDACDLGR